MTRSPSSRIPWKPLAGLFMAAAAVWVFGGFGSCALIPAESGTDGAGGTPGQGGVLDPEPATKEVGIICSNTVTDTFPSFPWELTVDPGPIESGGKFSATFDAVPFFPRDFFEIAQLSLPEGVTQVNLVDFKVTVSAHAGATGPDVVLTMPDLPYQCALEDPPGTRVACDPANDLPGGPGPVANTDCVPEGSSNSCGRFVDIPISEDCAPGGVCWNVGRDEPGATLCPEDDFCQEDTKIACASNGFCVTDELLFPLAPAVGEFVADTDGEVLFGWHEPDRGSSWIEPPSFFAKPIGFNGFRLYVGVIPLAFECVLSRLEGGPLPDEGLISFDIPEYACGDGTHVCPQGFSSTNDKGCHLSAESEVFVAKDPIVREDPSLSSCEGPVDLHVGQSDLPSEAALDSPSLMVRTVTRVTNVDDALCSPSNSPVAETHYWDAQDEYLQNNLIVFSLPSSVSFDVIDPKIRKAVVALRDSTVAWSATPDVCCERTFQVTWDASVPECEGW